jgi:hypothetical protein
MREKTVESSDRINSLVALEKEKRRVRTGAALIIRCRDLQQHRGLSPALLVKNKKKENINNNNHKN